MEDSLLPHPKNGNMRSRSAQLEQERCELLKDIGGPEPP